MTTDHYDVFTGAINLRRIVIVSFHSKDGIKTRRCIPFDYAQSNRYHDVVYRYHFFDLEGTGGPHNLSLLPENIIKIEMMPDTFEPEDYVKWKQEWHYQRDWKI